MQRSAMKYVVGLRVFRQRAAKHADARLGTRVI